MKNVGKIIAPILFSGLLIGCTAPFIEVEVEIGGQGTSNGGRGGCPQWAIDRGWCIPPRGASIMEGTLKAIKEDGKVYTVETEDGKKYEFPSPPFKAEVETSDLGNKVIISLNEGTLSKGR